MARVKRVKSIELKGVTITPDTLRVNLATNLLWAVNGLLKIFEYQTYSEKTSGLTLEDNGVGFSGVDSKILTSFSEYILSQRSKNPNFFGLSDKQKVIVKKAMPKYSNQLFSILLEESLSNG